MELYSLTEEQLIEELNKAKELIVNTLEKQNLLNTTAEYINNTFVITIIKQSRFGQMFQKFFKLDQDSDSHMLVLQVPVVKPSEAEGKRNNE